MKVAGFGFRRDVTAASLRDALTAAGGHDGLAAVATLSDKAEATALKQLAGELNLSIQAVPADRLVGVATFTQSGVIAARFGTGSVAEAVALVAAGRHARLVSPRAVSRDGMATAAIAEGEGE
ncbi:cobalamin biosynthesis protein [Bradyrhizobium sp. 2TAF24]|uniref:cobalamin biosynthesis protein n=1 Tax=Bradyrhizobium sp. 2TAF24 TaxID=3233011 RepID=UPI003F92E7E8